MKTSKIVRRTKNVAIAHKMSYIAFNTRRQRISPMTTTATKSAEAAFEAFSGPASDAMKKSYERSVELFGEVSELQKKNLEALTESSRITTKGIEELSTRAAAFSKDAFEKGVEAAKTVTSAKSVQEAMEFQASYTKTAFETYLEEMNAVTGMFATLVRDASAPLNSQAGQFVSMMQKSA